MISKGAANFSRIKVISSIYSTILVTLVTRSNKTKFTYGILYYDIRKGITTMISLMKSPLK